MSTNNTVGDGTKSSLDLPPFPAEQPTRQPLEDYLDAAGPILRSGGYGPAMRGEHPPHLIALALTAQAPDIPSLSEEDRRSAGPAEAVKHDQLVAKAARERESARQQLRAGLLEYHNKLAAKLERSLRPFAALRLKSMLITHAVQGAPGCYAGGAMWRELLDLKNRVCVLDDTRDHDRAIEHLRDNVLEDGCSVKAFADRINELQRHHDHLERKFTPESLGRFIIDLMPNCNKAEGRALLKELTASNQLGDSQVVIYETTKIVQQSQRRPSDNVVGVLAEGKACYGKASSGPTPSWPR